MSNNTTGASQRPSLFSYISGSTNTPRRRSSSLTLPKHDHRREDRDPYEKVGRHGSYSKQKQESMSEKVPAAWMNQGTRARYIKTGCLIFFVLAVLYYIIPGGRYSSVPGAGKFPGGDVASDPSVATSKCTRSYSKDKPLIQYALMVDAGSTGSRIHVYKFNNCGPTPELEDEIFKMTEKREGGSGLSSYKGDAEGAAKSLDVLMDVAVKNVPDKLKGCTPVAVKATAGLRKLGPEMSDAILKAVRNRLETVYPFPVVSEENGGVQVMDGKDEGVYAWITTNYLLGKIGGPDKTPTAAVFDLGGGSTQIVFQPTFKEASDGGMPEQLAPGDHKYDLKFGGREFTLYQHSYLGYGLMEARNNLHSVIIEGLHENNPQSKTWLSKPISNPCFGIGMSKEVEVNLREGHPLGSSITVNMTGPAVGSPAQCRALAEKTLKKEAECKLAPCAFNGVHQPSLEKTFSREDVYLFSYFYDRTRPLGMPESFTLRELKDLAARVCQGGDAWKVFESVPGALEELEDRPETCLDLNFMMALLHTGYEMPIDREVKIAKKIKGNELGWCLGASLPLLSQESGWSCKVQKVQ
ncbi:putative guanosine-diphosphatase [Fulvia fulva]|uniref:guanosine-diphosphatase n=1 Tax=Passalora fulva TaxID=5499 RepID=A0A9Q8L9X6_PASFU|nr:putative guanosine-diphosphatase [Fulvia fulva]KAK4632033.1 putative guanosine-diphosphatase [Fulvia fulva]KAK4633032.1 putative guanosine-diphosphatase [Fulvia fulva]UJO13563.1 putative guanosine-diphosphatase [Fulvia fulva]WPV11513.1 putative guanosine-diphosphatase [Fulvia fulva]WPV26328.1 putative guanosine-diphosphatase [Fulvia fulva]